MSRLDCVLVYCTLVMPLSLVGQEPPQPALPADSPSEPAAVQPFTCETYDGVKLVGDFYPPGRGRGQLGPVVMLLHPIGPGKANSSRHDFGTLPRRLQAEGLGVVTFDFRGYGESQTIDPAKYFAESSRTSRDKNITRIDARDFRTQRDYANLANDLVAVKVWLNGKNNEKACSSHHLAVLGVEQAATVALIWLANEAQDENRPLDVTTVKNGRPDRFEIADLRSVLWVSLADRLGNERFNPGLVQRWMTELKDKSVQTLAIVSDGDANAKLFWDRAQNWIKNPRDAEAFAQTQVRRVVGTPLAGLKLLEHEAFDLTPAAIEYLDQTLLLPQVQWQEHKGNKKPTAISFKSLGM